MSTLPMDDWDPDLFLDLNTLLLRVSSPHTTRSTVQHLFQQLDKATPWLLTLTQLPEPTAAEKQETEKNPITAPSGTVYQVTGALAQAAAEVSAFLSVSHRLAANLIIRADERQYDFVARERGEIAAYLLHSFLGQMLDFLHELIRLTLGPEREEEEPFISLRGRVEDLLQRRIPVGTGEGTLVDLILNQLDSLQRKLDDLVKPQRLVGSAYDLLAYRVRCIRDQQTKLAAVLALIAKGGHLGRGHVVKLLKWLKKAERADGIVMGLLAIFYTTSQPIDSIEDSDPRLDNVEEWCRDVNFLKVASNLVFVEQWSLPGLREAARISWALFIVSTLRHDPNAGVVGIDPHLADSFLVEAINGDALQFLYDYVTSKPAADVDELIALATHDDRSEFVLSQIQGVLELLAAKKHFLRNLRNREEDNSNRRPAAISPPHFTTFINLLAAVHERLPLDSAQYLWDDVTFTSAVLDGRSNPSPSVWHLLAVISAGPSSAPKAFDRLQGTSASPFAALHFYQHYTSELPKLVDNMKNTRERAGHKVRQEDLQLGMGLTDVLASIAKYSSVVRTRLLQNKPHPIQLLFEMLNCEWELPMKASVLNAITAFCHEVDADTYTRIVDHHDRVSYPETSRIDPRSGKSCTPHGWLKSLETIEDGQYPLSRAYIRFLTSLLPSQNLRVELLLRRAVSFVLGQLASIGIRRFAIESERWEMLDETLAFVERALMLFDMSHLVSDPSRQAWRLFDQPGFAVLLHLLERDVKIFPLLSTVVDSLPTASPSKVTNGVRLKILRIFLRVLDIQLVFAEILLPALERPLPDKSTKPFPLRRPASLEPLDLRLLNHLSNVNIIALWVNDADLAVSLISTKIIAALAVSPHFSQTDRFVGDYHRTINRLAGYIDASNDSIPIAQAFCNRLREEGVDLSTEDMRRTEEQVLRDEATTDPATLPLVIRSAILDILLDGTTPDATGPNLAHFLIGFELKGHHFKLQDPSQAGSRYSCLQIILTQLDEDSFTAHPVIAAKTVQLVYQLFAHPATGKAVMSYTTSAAPFAVTQLRNMAARCPAGEPQGVAEYADQSIWTAAESLIAHLDYERWVASCVALEIHANEGKATSAKSVAAELFGEPGEDKREPVISQILASMDVVWREETEQIRALEFYGHFNFDSFKQPDAEHYDIIALRHALSSHRQGQVKEGKDGAAIDREADYIVRRLESRNRETVVNVAKGNLLVEWASLLSVALGSLFTQHVPEERQEAVLFELLDALLVRIGREGPAIAADLLAEAVVVTMNTLKSVLVQYDGVNLPVDQLANLLNQIIDALVRPGATENTRGNLYATMSQYLTILSITIGLPDDVSISTVLPGSVLQQATIAILNARKERFLAVLCKDAMDVRDVWKTECFALLGAMVAACSTERDRKALAPLKEYLPLFVRTLKDREIALQECLSPEADHLHVYWVFEAEMGFLLSLAATSRGAEDLLNAGLFEILSTCSYVAAEPYAEDSRDHLEAVSRQHRVFTSILQLLVRSLASLYRTSRSGAGHALGFLNAHRDAIILVLRETQQTPSLAGIRESRLIVAILAMIVHKVPETDRRNGPGFGALHLAVLGLASRYLDPIWSETPGEVQSLEKDVLHLNQVILAYLCSFTSGLGSGSGYPVLLNGLPGGGSQRTANAPSLGLAAQALDGMVQEVQELSSDYERLAERVQHDAELSQAEMERLERLDWAEETISPDSLRQAFTTRWHTLYNMIESALLLVWRHSLYYANGSNSEPIQPSDLTISLAGSVTGRSGVGQMRQLRDVAADLRGTLQRLGDIVEPEDLRRTGEQSEAYFGMLIRRLSELSAGLCGEEA